ncbi:MULTISPECIES: sigma-E factor regulatory protein RseB [Candidatus Williamhamiltonella]|uniref:Sigma-E factor regulatory protein RseB n=1 Tax=Candidatus Williamhamiltonella defendens TaxID=138072 RepID=A0A2D3TFM0_9ENTR|nr:sigma-E factor regulatory protein RseB [Candidatus Hamiltonella defensa]ATW34612.1 sigma-E factor regulatory protein RseB [Candidatus Hamiltonella defensa]AYB49860.1 sigma-E factor regulatory protein RseB [Candidatus Hamiltonella defensa]
MHPFLLFVILLIAALSPNSAGSEQPNAGMMLQEMSTAIRSLNYEFNYIQADEQDIDSLRYRHVILNGKTFAQLLRMDQLRVEVRQNNDQISYFQSDLTPFTLLGTHIVDAFPSVVFSDFSMLSQYYHYIFVGKMRIADRICQIIRVLPKENNRYSYFIWLDEVTKLPMQINLLNLNGQTLEQFKVISLNMGDNLTSFVQNLKKAPVPPLMKLPEEETVNFDWFPKWLPAGFVDIPPNEHQLMHKKKFLASRFYTDGLFSFLITVSPVNKKNNTESHFQQSRRTIQTQVRDHIQMTVVGEIPLSTAKRIADNLILKINK